MNTQKTRRSFLGAIVSSVLVLPTSARSSGQREEEQNTRLSLKKFSAPFYPLAARRGGLAGKITAVAHVVQNGTVSEVTDFDGHVLFQSAVLDAVKGWQFEGLYDKEERIQISFQFLFRGKADKQILHYKVSATLPDSFQIEVNPFPNTYS